MKSEEIVKFMDKKLPRELAPVKISFKTRSAIKGMFIKTSDYKELSGKNLWRIVSEGNIKSFHESKDESLARIFNGTDFTRLEVAAD